MADEAAGFRPRARYLAIASVLVALAVLIAVSAGGSSPGAKARPISKSGALRVVQADQPAVLGVYAGGRRIRARGLRVAAATAPAVTPAPVVTPLLGYETPVAVPS